MKVANIDPLAMEKLHTYGKELGTSGTGRVESSLPFFFLPHIAQSMSSAYRNHGCYKSTDNMG